MTIWRPLFISVARPPEKRRGRLVGPGRGGRGSRQAVPSPTGTMVPTIQGPEGVEKPSCGVVPRPEFRGGGSPARRPLAPPSGPCAQVVPAKRRGLGGAQPWGRRHCQDVGRPPTQARPALVRPRLASSTGCGLRPSRHRPVVPRARRRGVGRFLVTSVVPNVPGSLDKTALGGCVDQLRTLGRDGRRT